MKIGQKIPLFFAFAGLLLFASAFVVGETIRENRDEITIISNSQAQSSKPEIKIPKTQDPKTQKTEVPRFQDPNNQESGQESVLGESDEDLSRLSVNMATMEELDTVPGVGSVTAQKIIDGRPWGDLEECLELISARWREEARGKVRL